jgi:hypothetical protein
MRLCASFELPEALLAALTAELSSPHAGQRPPEQEERGSLVARNRI